MERENMRNVEIPRTLTSLHGFTYEFVGCIDFGSSHYRAHVVINDDLDLKIGSNSDPNGLCVQSGLYLFDLHYFVGRVAGPRTAEELKKALPKFGDEPFPHIDIYVRVPAPTAPTNNPAAS